MILADKIIKLRKKNGWSQEELAEKMNVSRQAVAKWEGAQTVPNLEKLLQLGELFGVTTDYLLKDEIEDEEFTDSNTDSPVRRVTLAEANEFLAWRETASVRIAVATFLCIISVIPLIILGGASEYSSYGITEDQAGVIGITALLITVAVAVAIFISCGFQNAPYEYLNKDIFDTEYGVKGMVLEKQKAFRNTYTRYNITGTCLCIISVIPLLASDLAKSEFLTILMIAVMFLIAGIGVVFFILAGVRWSSMQKLLQEGDFSPKEQKKDKLEEEIGAIYWPVVTAAYLAWSFITNDWARTWIIWPVAAVLFAAVVAVYKLIKNNKT